MPVDPINGRLDAIEAKLNEVCQKITRFLERLDSHISNSVIHQVPPCEASKEEFKRVRHDLENINTRLYKALMGALAGITTGAIGFIVWMLKDKLL